MNGSTGYAIVFFFIRPGRITRTYFGWPRPDRHTLADVKRLLVEKFPGAVFLAAEFQEADHNGNHKRRFQWWPGELLEIKEQANG